MPNGLSKSEMAKEYVSQAISISPCFLGSPDFLDSGRALSLFESRILGTFVDWYSIKSMFGPQWDDDKAKICGWGWASKTARDLCVAVNEMELYSKEHPFGLKEVSSRIL